MHKDQLGYQEWLDQTMKRTDLLEAVQATWGRIVWDGVLCGYNSEHVAILTALLDRAYRLSIHHESHILAKAAADRFVLHGRLTQSLTPA